MPLLAPLRLLVALPLLTLPTCQGDRGDVALGVLARERVSLTATANEIVTALPVAEGTPVEAGTVLVELDDSIQRANVLIAEAEVARARADLDKMTSGARAEEVAIAEARVAAARAAFTEAATALDRDRKLLDSDTITEARFEQSLSRRDAAEADLRSAELTLEELNTGAREEDLRIAEAQVAAAEARLDAQRRTLADLQIRASRDGVLDSLPWNLGERVPVGSPVAVMLAGDRPFARVYMPEPVRVRVSQGTEVEVRIDGREAPLAGTVRWISDEAAFTPYYALDRDQRSRLVYLAEIDLPPEADDLPEGIPVEVTLP